MMMVNGFQIPNALVDQHMTKMPKVALQCYLFIARKTLGWHKSSDAISLSQFQEGGISPNARSGLTAALKWLEGEGLIFVSREAHTNTYMLIDHTGQHQTTPKKIKKPKNPKNSTLIKKQFETFWEHFPNRSKKAEAQKLFEKLSATHREELLSRVANVAAYHRGDHAKEREFVPSCPNPATFIRNRRWEDEVYQPKVVKKSQKGGAKYQGVYGTAVARLYRMADGDTVQKADSEDTALLGLLGLTEDEVVDRINTYGRDAFIKTVMQAESEDHSVSA